MISCEGISANWGFSETHYRSGTLNSNTVNSKFHLISKFL